MSDESESLVGMYRWLLNPCKIAGHLTLRPLPRCAGCMVTSIEGLPSHGINEEPVTVLSYRDSASESSWHKA